MSRKRLHAILAIVLAFVMLFSVLYLALEAGHDCHGDGCRICERIRACTRLLRELMLSLALLLLSSVLFCVFPCVSRYGARVCRQLSLISLKVKLSD